MHRQLKASGASIHSLPPELLGKVFAGVGVYEWLRLDHVCRAWNKELHTGAAAAAAWQTLSLSRHLNNSIGILGKEGLMAAWAIRHRDFVKELIIAHDFSDEWVMVLGPWLTAVESIVTGQRSSLRHWYWVVMGMPKLTRLELGICLHHMHLDMLARLTQLTSLSLNMIEDSSINSEEEGLFVDPQGLHPLSALRQLRELRLTHSSVPHMPPGVSQLSNLLYLEFHTDWTTPASVILPSLTRLAQLQALVLRGDAVEMRTLSLDSGLSCLVNSRVLMVNSQTVLTHDFTNSFAAFHMSCLQVLDLSLPDGSRLPTHWLAPMHQLRVLAVCSNTLAGALPAHIVPLLNILIISVDYNIILPCTQPVLHVDTLPSVLDRMQSPQPLTIVCQRALIAVKMPAAQVRTLSSTGHFLVVSDRMPVKHIHQLVLRMLPPCLQQLCKQLRYLTIPCYLK